METNKCILKYVVSHLSHTIVSLSDSLDLCLKFRSTLVSQPCSMYIYMYMYILSFLVQETHNYYKKQCVSRLRKTLSKSNTIFMNVKCLVCMILVNRTDFPKLFWQRVARMPMMQDQGDEQSGWRDILSLQRFLLLLLELFLHFCMQVLLELLVQQNICSTE